MPRISDNMDKQFEFTEEITEELHEISYLHNKLQRSHKECKNLGDAKSVKDVGLQMCADIRQAVRKVKLIKVYTESSKRIYSDNRDLPGYGCGTYVYCSLASFMRNLKGELLKFEQHFNMLRQDILFEYNNRAEVVYFELTGKNPDDQATEDSVLMDNGAVFLQNVIEETSKEKVMETISEIQEMLDVAKLIDAGLEELQQSFLDLCSHI